MIYPHIHSNVTSYTAKIQQLIQHRKMSANRVEYFAAAKINPSNTELNPICHSLALLRVHHILHVSRVRVNN